MTLLLQTDLPPYTLPFDLLTWEPKAADIKLVFKNGDFERKIHTNIQIDPHEEDLIKQTRALQKELNVTLRRTMESRILRHLSHARSDVPKALESLAHTQEWRRTFFNPPLSDAPDSLGRYLNSGFVYYCGRDCGYRPMLFVKPTVAFKSGWSLEICQQLFAFALEFALRHLFIPGKVECIMVVLDLGGCTTWQLRCEELRSIAAMLSKTYVGRLYTLFVVNAPTFVAGLWSLAKNFLSDRQQAKTVFCKKMIDVRKQSHCAKHQLEEKYGGSQPDLLTLYPFSLPPGPFAAEYDGPPALDSVPNAHICVCSLTCVGTLCVERRTVPRIKWSSKGASILKLANITIPERESSRSRTRADYNRVVSIMTDFPEDEELVSHALSPRVLASLPLEKVVEPPRARAVSISEAEVVNFDEFDNDIELTDVCEQDSNASDYDSAVSDRVITHEEASAAISRLQRYRNHARGSWAQKFWCCASRKKPVKKEVKNDSLCQNTGEVSF